MKQRQKQDDNSDYGKQDERKIERIDGKVEKDKESDEKITKIVFMKRKEKTNDVGDQV